MDNTLNNKKNQKITTFTEQEKDANRAFSVNSEEIVSFIVEKLISFTITEAQRHETNDQIPKKCFGYFIDVIHYYLKLEFLPYDKDDYFPVESSQASKNVSNNNIINNNAFSQARDRLESNVNINNIGSRNSKYNNNNYNKKDNNNSNNIKNANYLYNSSSNSNTNINAGNGSGSVNNNFYNNIKFNNQKNLNNPSSESNKLFFGKSKNSQSQDADLDSSEDSLIEKDDSKQNKSMSSIDMQKLDQSFNKLNVNSNDNINAFNFQRNIFFDNHLFGVNDWTIMNEPVNQIYYNRLVRKSIEMHLR